mgnify:CR=1 FL=1
MIQEFQLYYNKARLNQERLYQGYDWTEEDIDDDLIWHVPIYDVVNRRYAAFSSLLEAVKLKEADPKGNGDYFKYCDLDDTQFIMMCYLFRLCGSGINYFPKTNHPYGTHGFGNFWVVDSLLTDRFTFNEWIMDNMWGLEIYEVVDLGNEWLLKNGYKGQNFVLCAFAMDLAEYYPDIISRLSKVYIGSNARKCLKEIFPNEKGIGSNLKVTNECLERLCALTGNHSYKYDMEDVACDFIRYKNNFQSKHHIEYNKGIKYYNSVFK